MPLFVLKILKWLVGKGLVLLIAGVLVVAAFALWIFVSRSYGTDEVRRLEHAELQQQASEVYAKLESTHKRLAELGGELDEHRRRIEAANRTIEYLGGLLERFTRFFTETAEERAETERQLQAALAEREEQTRLRNAKTNEQNRLRIDRVSFAEQAKELEARLSEIEQTSSKFVENVNESWQTLKPYLLVSILAAILLPLAWKLFAFYVWAPLLSLGGPIRLVAEKLPLPVVSSSGVSTQVKLQQGEVLWVKESYLQASDESLERKTRFVLNWSIPATCLAAGLTELIELKGGDYEGSVTVSPQKRPELEVAMIEVPERGQLVVRPSSVAGVVSRSGDPISIKRRWRLFHPQAWMTFQFRYFIFQGPCAVIVTGIRGVRCEILDTADRKGRRSNQIATIGFTPDLAYGVVRAETFWSYFRKFNPLFDDVFRGKGVFLCQEISEEEATRAAKFWSGLWNSVLKLLGV